jgi:serine/threonine-protein kinase
MIGKTIDDKYEIKQLIGEGAMGAVYEARNTETDRKVALKLITHGATKDKKLLAQLEEDTKEAAKLITPRVVEVLDEGIDPKTEHPYVVTELLRGENVRALLERLDHLQPEVAARLVGQVCLGLEKAHAAGLVHRDLKPANLFLVRSDDGARSIKLLDFGVGRLKMDHALTNGNKSLVRGLSMLGSPLYMSPEQAGCEKAIDHRSDIWSLGIVLYELLTGAAPHKKAKSLDALIEAIRSEEPTALRDTAEWVSPELADIAHSALRLDPKDRYPSIEEMRKALESYVPSSWSISEDDLVAMTDEQRSPWSPEEDTRRVKLAALEAEERRREAAEKRALDDADAASEEDEKVGETDDGEADGEAPSAGDDAEELAASPLSDADEAEPEAAGPEGEAAKDEPVEAAAPTPASAEGGGSNRGLKAVGIGVVLGLVVIVAYVLLGRGDGPAEPVAASAAAAPTAVDTAPDTAGAGGAPATETAEPADAGEGGASAGDGGTDAGRGGAGADAGRGGADAGEADTATAKVKVTPPFAAVALDGDRAEVKDGHIEIAGEEGSVHTVVVTVAGRTKTVKVTLGPDGPKPNHIIFVPNVPRKSADDGDLYE